MSEPGTMGKLLGAMALFIAIGAPAVLYSWSTLSDALEGHFDLWSAIISLLLLGLLLLECRVLGRFVASSSPSHSESRPDRHPVLD